jgi:hypothetical protein
MAVSRVELSEQIRERVAQFEAELRQLIYGERACPEWGTSFAILERLGMSIGEEVSRQFMAASAGEQGKHIPREALECAGERAGHLVPKKRELLTEAGPITYETPTGYLPKSRRDFFPSGEGAGDGL